MTVLFARSAFFFSGVAALVFEIVWLRYLGLAMGATTLAIATITAAYMGGLALGSHVGGLFADKIKRPLLAYGILEMAIAAFGLFVPVLCQWIPKVDASLFADLSSGTSRAFVRFVVSMAILIVPTTAMGMTLPILARFVVRKFGDVGKEVGLLYALNLAGAIVGAAAAGFVLIPSMGFVHTNWFAVVLDSFLGLLAVMVGWAAGPLVLSTTPAPSDSVLAPKAGSLMGMLFVTGAGAMTLQVLWTRALGTALGPSTYAFSAIVCAYLVGLALGSMVAAKLSQVMRRLRMTLALVLLWTGLAAFVGIALVDDLPLLLQHVVLDPTLTLGGLMGTKFGLAALSLVPATAGMGAIFPLTLAVVAGSASKVGAAVGRTYAFNTLGNIFGCFGAVFLLLPLFGVEMGMRVTALTYVILSGLLVWFGEQAMEPGWRKTMLVGIGLTCCVMLVWPKWNTSLWTSGMFRISMTRTYYDVGGFEPSDLIFHKDGLSTTVTVEEDQGVRWIKVNGKIDGSSEGDMPTQVLSGILPIMLHQNPKQVLVIGCGSGVTIGAALQGDVQNITLVELDQAVVQGSKLFAAVNHAYWDDPRVTIIEDDGRNYLRRLKNSVDIIVSEPSNPWMTGAASLFTSEFFGIAASRLHNDGVFLQWLQIYELSSQRIASVLKTFQDVFPYVLVFTPEPDSNDLLLIGKRTPFQLEWSQLQERFASLKQEMMRAGVYALEDLLALVVFGDAHIRALPVEIPKNTDDNAYVEFGAPKDLLVFSEQDAEVAALDMAFGQRVFVLEQVITELGQRPSWAADLSSSYLRHGMLTDAEAAAEKACEAPFQEEPACTYAKETAMIAALLEEPDRKNIFDKQALETDATYAKWAKWLKQGKSETVLEEIKAHEHSLQNMNKESEAANGPYALLKGFLLYSDGSHVAARKALLKAVASLSSTKLKQVATYYLAKNSFGAGEYAQAAEEMAAYQKLARGLPPTVGSK